MIVEHIRKIFSIVKTREIALDESDRPRNSSWLSDKITLSFDKSPKCVRNITALKQIKRFVNKCLRNFNQSVNNITQ